MHLENTPLCWHEQAKRRVHLAHTYTLAYVYIGIVATNDKVRARQVPGVLT